MSPGDRRLVWDACLNVRDLGGLRTADGRVTRSGALVRASMIGTLTDSGVAAMRAHDVRTVVDLRWPSEVEAAPSIYAAGMAYRNVPVDNERQLALLDQHDEASMAAHLRVLARPESGIADAIETIADSDPAVLMHCSAGRDRTGVVAALILAAVGVIDEDIDDDYRASDDDLVSEYERFAAEHPEARDGIAAAIASRRRAMPDFLRALRRNYGDATGYLGALGVTSDSIARLRELLVA